MYCTCGTSTVFWIFLDRWNLPLLHNRYINNSVDVLHLWHLHSLLDFLDRWNLPLLHHRHV